MHDAGKGCGHQGFLSLDLYLEGVCVLVSVFFLFPSLHSLLLSRTETIYDRWNDARAFVSGGRVACYGGDLADMLEEIRLVEPSSVSFAPRIWNQLHAEYLQAIRDAPHAESEINDRFA
jgi:long-subunit acyl-CoA synthetase (AMP-forming)